jgi:single-stranded DNA-binding protein
MSINLVLEDGIVKSLSLKYDSQSRPELRWTLVQTEKDWPLYLPCCAVGAAAERLASELEDGQHIVVTSGKLCYRKRDGKAGPQSRMEILVWAVDRLTSADALTPAPSAEPNSTSEEPALNLGQSGEPPSKKPRKPRYARWKPEHAN